MHGKTTHRINTNSKIKFSEFELDNGLKVILSKDKSIPAVAINVCYHVGSKDESVGKTGYAHLFEHLMFSGSKNVAPGEYDKYTSRAGGRNNAYTTEDKTNYYIELPSNELELGLWLESDRMFAFAVTEKALQTQKNVVIEEKKQNFDNRPFGTISIEFAKRLFKKSNYRWDTIGSIEDLEKASISDIKQFFEQYYVPNNAVLSIAGDINVDETLKLVDRYFGKIKPSAKINRTKFEEDPLTNETRDKIYDKVHFPGIFIAYRTPQEGTREQYDFSVLAEILGSGDSSRLYRELVYKQRLVSEAGCFTDSRENAGIYYIYAILMPGIEIQDVQNSIDRIVDEIREHGAEEREVQKAKNKIESHYIYRKQTNLFRADMLAHFKTFHNDAELVNTNIQNYLNVTRNSVHNSLNRFIQPSNRVVLYYVPEQTMN